MRHVEDSASMDGRGVERAQLALSALLEGNPKVKGPDEAATLAIDTWNVMLGAPNARALLEDIPAADMVALRDWMVASIAEDSGLPLDMVVKALDQHVKSANEPTIFRQ